MRRGRVAPGVAAFGGDWSNPLTTVNRFAAGPHRPGGGSTLLVPSRQVADEPAQATVYEVSCPHCGKAFREELLSGPAARYHGFKCPHCRLFVPYERAETEDD